MTNLELNQLSLKELRELNHKVIEIIKLKNFVASRLNADIISVGMTVGIETNNPLLIGHKFLLEKINKKYAVCKDIQTDKSWNVLICNVYEYKDKKLQISK
jgi:hypothetical protein